MALLLSFYVVMIAKEELSELDKIAVRENISQWINDGKLYRKIFLFKRRWEIYCEKKIFYSGYGWHCVSVLGFL